MAYLKRGTEVGPAEMAKIGDLDPTLVFRYAAVSESGRCAQYDGGCCGLGARIATMRAPVVDALPPCQIRSGCRWHAEQGPAAFCAVRRRRPAPTTTSYACAETALPGADYETTRPSEAR